MAADFSGWVTQIERLKGVRASVEAFISGASSRLDAAVAEAVAANDDADLTAITDFSTQLSAESDAFVAAITTNPGPPTEPVP